MPLYVFKNARRAGNSLTSPGWLEDILVVTEHEEFEEARKMARSHYGDRIVEEALMADPICPTGRFSIRGDVILPGETPELFNGPFQYPPYEPKPSLSPVASERVKRRSPKRAGQQGSWLFQGV